MGDDRYRRAILQFYAFNIAFSGFLVIYAAFALVVIFGRVIRQRKREAKAKRVASKLYKLNNCFNQSFSFRSSHSVSSCFDDRRSDEWKCRFGQCISE
jgi:hypothetical protein